MKKFKKIIAAMLTVAMMMGMSTSVFASETSESYVPDSVNKASQESGNPIIKLEEGVYSVGETVYVDFETKKVPLTENDTLTDNMGISTRGPKPPSTSKIWSWSDGSYFGLFEFSVRVFTEYRFTGYSEYGVEVFVDENPITENNGKFRITAIQDNNNYGASYDAIDGYANVIFTGCQAKERLAFSITKANDGSTIGGQITVSVE